MPAKKATRTQPASSTTSLQTCPHDDIPMDTNAQGEPWCPKCGHVDADRDNHCRIPNCQPRGGF